MGLSEPSPDTSKSYLELDLLSDLVADYEEVIFFYKTHQIFPVGTSCPLGRPIFSIRAAHRGSW